MRYLQRVERGVENLTVASLARFAACWGTQVADLFVTPALKRLPDLIDEATKRTVVIVSGDRAVKLTPVRAPKQRARHFGWQSLFEPGRRCRAQRRRLRRMHSWH